jgi:hypothetical protein
LNLIKRIIKDLNPYNSFYLQMYQYDFICTYKLMDDESDQEQLYRIQLLQAFNLNEWNDMKINTIIKDLYMVLSRTEEFKEIFAKARANQSIIEMMDLFKLSGEERLEENDIIFNLLFKFEYFDLLHRCIVDYLVNNNLSPKYVSNLMAAL